MLSERENDESDIITKRLRSGVGSGMRIGRMTLLGYVS